MVQWCALGRRAAACLAMIWSVGATQAEDMALVISDSGFGGSARHDLAVAALKEAGYEVFEGLDLDRARMASLSIRLEAVLGNANRLVIYLTGRVAEGAGLSVLMPFGQTGDGAASVLSAGIPLALYMDMAAKRPGQSLLAIGAGGGADALPPLNVPQGVLVLSGAPPAVDRVLVQDFLGSNLPATEIADTSVRFSGLVTPLLRLGVTPATAAADAGVPGSSPESVERALGLDLATRAEVQRDLAQLGHETGGIDGVFGNGTRTAIRAFQAETGLTVTGYLTGPQLKALTDTAAARREAANEAEQEGIAWDVAKEIDTLDGYREFLAAWGAGRFAGRAEARIDAIEAAAETAERVARYREIEIGLGLTAASVAVLEQRLGVQGFDAGPADGRIDRQTRRSIAAFQARSGLTSTGYFNTATLQRLIIAGGG